MVNLLPFFVVFWNYKDKIKVVGVARQQLHFLCDDKENEAKESFALRLACLGRKGGNLNSGYSDRSRAQVFPQMTRLLRASPFVETCIDCNDLCFSLVSHTEKPGPLTQGRVPITDGA